MTNIRTRLAWLLTILQIAGISLIFPAVATADTGDQPTTENPACPDPLSSARWAAERFSDVERNSVQFDYCSFGFVEFNLMKTQVNC